jgi:hypothetical protein
MGDGLRIPLLFKYLRIGLGSFISYKPVDRYQYRYTTLNPSSTHLETSDGWRDVIALSNDVMLFSDFIVLGFCSFANIVRRSPPIGTR